MTPNADHGTPALGNRYVQVLCPKCMAASPVCDQEADPRRQEIGAWYREHFVLRHPLPSPIWRSVPPNDGSRA